MSVRYKDLAIKPKSPPLRHPSSDDIDAIIQMATSARPSPTASAVKDTRTQLFVGNLPYRVRWQDLKDLFRKAGTVLRADVSLGPDNRSRGYGTVLLATAEDAGRAIDMFNGYSWQTRILEVRPDRLPPTDFDNPLGQAAIVPSPSFSNYHIHDESDDLSAMFSQQKLHNPSFTATAPATTQSRNLFVGNLPFHCQWQDLKDLFRQAGTIIRADVALGQDGRSRGFGTVVFANEIDAERAVTMFNGYEYNGRALKVHYDKFSQLGQLPLATPSGPNSPTLAANHHRPSLSHLSSLSGGYSHNTLQRNSDSSLYEEASTWSMSLISRPFSPESSRMPHLSVPPLQSTTRSHSSSTTASTESSSSLPRSADRESTTSVSSAASQFPPEASSTNSLPILPPKQNLLRTKPRVKSQPPSPPRTHSHPRHPGPISLPPRTPLQHFPLSPGTYTPGHSPLHHPYYNQHLTPHGLPPITPTMPPFTFIPQPSPVFQIVPPRGLQGSQTGEGLPLGAEHERLHSRGPGDPPRPSALRFAGPTHAIPLPSPPIMHAYGYPLSTPPLHTHTHPMFTPLSPGALWGGGTTNPYINPAVGQPVRLGYTGTPGDVFVGSNPVPGFTNITPGGDTSRGVNSSRGYFDFGYFPPVTTSEMKNVSEEIMKPRSESDNEVTENVGSGGASKGDPAVVGSTSVPQNAPSRTCSESAGDIRPTAELLGVERGYSDPVPVTSTWQAAPATTARKLNGNTQDQESSK